MRPPIASEPDLVAPGDDVAPGRPRRPRGCGRSPRTAPTRSRRRRRAPTAAGPSPSDAPSESTMVSAGRRSSRPRFTSGLNSTPDDVIARNDERSHRSGCAASASSSGRANTSPTMVSVCTCSRATASHTSSGSRPGRSTSTTVPPPASAASVANSPVPCISGRGRQQRRRPLAGARGGERIGRLGVRRVRRRPERDVEVVVAPHHALGHAGGAAGVEEDQVVARRRCAAVGSTPAAVASARS